MPPGFFIGEVSSNSCDQPRFGAASSEPTRPRAPKTAKPSCRVDGPPTAMMAALSTQAPTITSLLGFS